MNVAIINYGMGNLRSVQNAFQALEALARVAMSPADLQNASHVVLPGVGAFGDAMRNLRAGGWVEALEEHVRRQGKPFLGLCLGMQLLATTGTEFEQCEGLNWIRGSVVRLPNHEPAIRIPHIGWNDVRILNKNGVFAGLDDYPVFYFAHSFVLQPIDANIISAKCTHGIEFAAGLESGNIYATQFHPEKSQKAGLTVLRNFLARAG